MAIIGIAATILTKERVRIKNTGRSNNHAGSISVLITRIATIAVPTVATWAIAAFVVVGVVVVDVVVVHVPAVVVHALVREDVAMAAALE